MPKPPEGPGGPTYPPSHPSKRLFSILAPKFKYMASKLAIQTGKLQPVFIWREKPVLLALLSNLTIPVPASYLVFRTEWREIS